MNSRFTNSKKEKAIREKRDQMIEDAVMNNLASTMRETGKKIITLTELRKSGYRDHEMYDRLMGKQFDKKARPDIEAGYLLKDGSFRALNNYKDHDKYYDQITESAYRLKE